MNLSTYLKMLNDRQSHHKLEHDREIIRQHDERNNGIQ